MRTGFSVSFLVLIGLSIAMGLGGCSSGSRIELHAVDSSGRLSTDLPRGAYATGGSATADIYLTDLSLADLDPSVDFHRLSGQITHITLFLPPRAGRTPISDDACTATMRHVILNRGEVGVYAGGGFVRAGAPSQTRWYEAAGALSGTFSDATVKPAASTPGFADRLGTSVMKGSFRVLEDSRLAAQCAARLNEAMARAKANNPPAKP